MGATNVLDRVWASVGLLNGVKPEFVYSLDVANAGVLFALPALLSNGLLRTLDDYFELPAGYYTLQQIFLVIAFLALCRIKSYEQLRYCAPGEWGKVLGLDRIPEVKTLRKKIEFLSGQKKARIWSGALSNEWMKSDVASAGVLYIDGHTRVYHGSRTKLPRHYVARERLCLRATVDYWVNALDGKPFFRVNRAIDHGLLDVLRKEIVPALIRDVPGQPTDQQLQDDPLMHRFTLVFDREGYSPDFMLEMKELKIAIITYHKFPKDTWDITEFAEYTATQKNTGISKVMLLAERGTRLSNGLWIREIRCLKSNGHQTAIVTTDYRSDLMPIAQELFARWSQENYFKYMRENYNLDRLIDYSIDHIPETELVVNPEYKAITSKLRSAAATQARRKMEFAELQLTGDIEPQLVEPYEEKKAALQQTIEDFGQTIQYLKEQRKKIQRHIAIKDLPADQRFDALGFESKHLIDTVKMVAYRSETALAETLKEYLNDKEDARMLIKRTCTSEADLIPDKENKTLTIRLHRQASKSQDDAIRKLCGELNETETIFPGSDMRLVYTMIDCQVD